LKISINQLNQQELAAFVAQYSTGTTFSGAFVSYVLNSGWLGNNVVSTTGGYQTVTGVKQFLDSPIVPYSGLDPLSAASQSFTITHVEDSILGFSGFLPFAYVSLDTTQSINGAKTFAQPVIVALPTQTGHAVNLAYLQAVSGAIGGI